MNQELADALIRYDDHEDYDHFEEVTEQEFVRNTRWMIYWSQVWRDKRDGAFWKLTWARGATERQDEGPEDVSFEMVVPVEVTVVKYIPAGGE